MKKYLSLLLALSMVLALPSCNEKEESKTQKLEDTGTEKVSYTVKNIDECLDKEAEFSFELFKNSLKENENSLISPLSVLSALSMTINGAEGETLKEMEEAIGMDRDRLNNFMLYYMENLTSGEDCKLNLANSVWFNENGFTVNEAFLKKNAEYYGTDIFKSAFNDETLKDINSWVNENTDGMIPSILDKIDPKESMMFLINALAFEGKWITPYDESQVREDPFYKEDKSEITASYLIGNEGLYLKNQLAEGFIKPYKGNKYSFASLLPNEGVKLSELVSSLDGDDLRNLLKNPIKASVSIRLPKFETEYNLSMVNALKAMGMEKLFDENSADLSSLGTVDTNLYVDDVIHKTYISLGEQGTRAGAATVVAINKALGMFNPDIKFVELNRPFLYMLIDNETSLPFFIGTMYEPIA